MTFEDMAHHSLETPLHTIGQLFDSWFGESSATWPPITGVGLIDTGLVERLERLNRIPGIETLQSCSGAHVGAERPAHVWLKGRASDTACEAFLALPSVDAVSVLYGREPFPVTEIVFTCLEGFDELIQYLECRCGPKRNR